LWEGDLVFRIDYAWVDDYSLLSSAGNRVDGYELLDARIALESIQGPGDTKFTVALWGKNLNDELYYTTGYNLVTSLGVAARFTGPPRTYGLDVAFEF
jgi:iron complex outermembrane receptor protein